MCWNVWQCSIKVTWPFSGAFGHTFLRSFTLSFTLPMNLLSTLFFPQACMEMAQGEIQENRSQDGREEEPSQPEKQFLKELYIFMRRRDTPIERIPNLGFKQSKYGLMFQFHLIKILFAYCITKPITILENVASFANIFLISDLKKNNTISEWQVVSVFFFCWCHQIFTSFFFFSWLVFDVRHRHKVGRLPAGTQFPVFFFWFVFGNWK